MESDEALAMIRLRIAVKQVNGVPAALSEVLVFKSRL
jgi:hypothetical protein